MPKSEILPADRLVRMRASFDKRRAILADDYAHFATPRIAVKPRTERKRRGK